ncbi:MAG: YedE-related selenium metabolism membrane protein [Spirochaetaceae bacterium]|jgi:YedE family putative selenium metabolism protein|nr:YedE-related selenium metabolism membrane protein [Spirochaetaceae bacterium]
MSIKTDRIWFIVTGAVIGAAAIALMTLGNPANMGLCAACFIRDVAGALGLHGAAAVQYLRPEIAGFVLGAFLLAVVRRDWKPVQVSRSPLIRFTIAFFIMVGCLVFLGCPLRMALRVGAGDMNAVVGLAGFFAGTALGAFALKKGFNLDSAAGDDAGKGSPAASLNALIMPVFAVLLLAFLVISPAFIKFSVEGPGSQHAPWIIALVAAVVIGALCHESNFCIAGGFRDLFLLKKGWSFAGYLAVIVAAFVGNLLIGKFKPGFAGQPIAHTEALWNFLGMVLVGFGSVLIGGCPLRQLIKAGQGNADASVCVLAFILAGAIAHNFGIAASGSGVPVNGKIAVVAGLAVVALFALLSRPKSAAA